MAAARHFPYKKYLPERFLALGIAVALSFVSLVVYGQPVFGQSVHGQIVDQQATITSPSAGGSAPSPGQDQEGGGFLAEITVNSAEEVEQALKRAEQLFEQGVVGDDTGPATFILYGPEVSIFLKENYQQNKAIVDLAARLSAFNVVDIKVCEVRLGLLGRDKNAVHPFVGTVPFGPGEVDRLIKKEKFRYF